MKQPKLLKIPDIWIKLVILMKNKVIFRIQGAPTAPIYANICGLWTPILMVHLQFPIHKEKYEIFPLYSRRSPSTPFKRKNWWMQVKHRPTTVIY